MVTIRYYVPVILIGLTQMIHSLPIAFAINKTDFFVELTSPIGRTIQLRKNSSIRITLDDIVEAKIYNTASFTGEPVATSRFIVDGTTLKQETQWPGRDKEEKKTELINDSYMLIITKSGDFNLQQASEDVFSNEIG